MLITTLQELRELFFPGPSLPAGGAGYWIARICRRTWRNGWIGEKMKTRNASSPCISCVAFYKCDQLYRTYWPAAVERCVCVSRVLKRMRDDVLDRLEEPIVSLSPTPYQGSTILLDTRPSSSTIRIQSRFQLPLSPIFVLITIETNSFESMEPFFLSDSSNNRRLSSY